MSHADLWVAELAKSFGRYRNSADRLDDFRYAVRAFDNLYLAACPFPHAALDIIGEMRYNGVG